MAEGYVRPPLLGSEPPSDRAAIWRFRILLLIVFAALAIAAFLVVRLVVAGQNNEGSPSVGTMPSSAVVAVS